MLLFPFLGYLAILTSIVMLALLAAIGEVSLRSGVVLTVWLLTAGYAQFFGASMMVGAVGLVLQTLLALYLTVRWRLTG